MFYLNEKNLDSTLSKHSGLSLLVFGAKWCGPCKALEPTLEKISKQHPDLIVGKIDVEESPGLANKYHVQCLPKLILMKDKEYIAEKTGACSESQLKDFLRIS